ncbi:helix-turn-helix domain-containing protein [Actinomadura citrea]|uniref:Transcriptional regulator with XRE-family HTH domain n=1 Tax=Actinomadura citrea TaxID=46158 RepID=A0A7Y9KCW6_9ACTN|nr:helix-turn-helix domain-containing protein [Actinomadura citrea]NYE11453.1 transcriptional regulator with XRE-family HTH domain [Actinomadura citrea]GGT76213.1 DNA-binding protein [Actinomadura citrea]
MSVAEDTIARNRALQAEWYGEPLGDRVRPLLGRLGMSQSGLAGVLGLSAPMLSQLMSGQRAKISNPAVLHRLMAVEDLVAGPGFDALTAAGLQARLEGIKGESAATTSGMRGAVSGRVPTGPVPAGPEGAAERAAAEPARLVQALLREVASAAEIEAAAGLVADRFPDLAEVLRVYGTGRTSEAEAHFARTVLKQTPDDRTVMPERSRLDSL